ncbi:TRAP transporter small permease [Burkholderia sp. IT-111MI5]
MVRRWGVRGSARAGRREKERAHRRPLLTAKGDGNGSRNIFVFLIEFYRRSPALMALHLAGTLIAWFAPDDALKRLPVLKPVVTAIGEVFPLLPKAIEKSLFPDVTELYFALMLAAIPLRIFEAFRLCYAEREEIVAGYFDYSWKRKAFAFLVAILFFSGSVFLLIFHGQYFDWNFMSVGKSRFWLGMVGPLFAGGYLVICFVVASVAILSLLCCVFFVEKRG